MNFLSLVWPFLILIAIFYFFMYRPQKKQAAKRKALLTHFGGVKGVQAASVEDLARVPGISRTLAQRIYAELH